jgi:hypothetical protein
MKWFMADGANQTRYLFGLDLIYQDDGSETRYLLADGLGSVRAELVSDTVDRQQRHGLWLHRGAI